LRMIYGCVVSQTYLLFSRKKSLLTFLFGQTAFDWLTDKRFIILRKK